MILTSTAAAQRAEEIAEAYAQVFAEPPFNRDPQTSEPTYLRRFRADCERPGFRAAVATSASGIDAFAIGWETTAPFRADRAYPQVRDQLGSHRVDTALVGTLEVDELGVHPRSRGQGLGRTVLNELVDGAADRGAWLLTWSTAPETIAFYRHLGWTQFEPQRDASTGAYVENDIVVFVSPQHALAH